LIRFIIRRLGFVALSMLMASVIIFAATQVIPGDITAVILGQFATAEAKANLRVELGLNHPLVVQYLDWLWGFIRGDWGRSISLYAPVREVVFTRLYNSAILAAVGFAMFVPLGLLLGVVSAIRRNSWVDHTISIGSLVFVGLPEFVTGIILIYVFALQLGWLPAQSAVDFSHGFWQEFPRLVLPGITVSLASLAYVARMTRSSTVAVLEADGTLIHRWGGPDMEKPGNFYGPHCICVDSKGDVYVGEVTHTDWVSKGLAPEGAHMFQKFARK